MSLGRIVFQGKTLAGKDFVIRYPQDGDAPKMCDYINALSKEKTFIRFQGEQVSVEEEERYLSGQLGRIREGKTVQLFVVCDDKIVGISGIDLKDKTESHEGVFGISVAKEFRGEGLGKELMRLVIEEAEENLIGLKVITLGVFESNVVGLEMYKKFGFVEYGRLPEGSRYGDKYVDVVFMYRRIG